MAIRVPQLVNYAVQKAEPRLVIKLNDHPLDEVKVLSLPEVNKYLRRSIFLPVYRSQLRVPERLHNYVQYCGMDDRITRHIFPVEVFFSGHQLFTYSVD